ncbi:DUF4381 domain-containing protein [Methylomonas sp. AM2-LC]|uniref:DUF4381 domain-containing protein n=1 Tax=Methylomonas sp. AM2-LC TaxID=3153301 RepID=UPI003266F2EA
MEQLPLKDIHFPEAVSIWPLAPGWYMLAVLILLCCFGVVYLYKRLKSKTVLKVAAKVLVTIRADENLDNLQTLGALSTWLRRVAISNAPRSDVASLSGSDWLSYLDTHLHDAPFSKGIGRCLAESQYQRSAPEDLDLDALFKLCERWLKCQKPSKPQINNISQELRTK